MRTCIACRQTRPKRELLRLVHIPDGNIKIDSTGKMTGRGAYVCPNLDCWEVGLKNGRLEYALSAKLTQENQDELIKGFQEA